MGGCFVGYQKRGGGERELKMENTGSRNKKNRSRQHWMVWSRCNPGGWSHGARRKGKPIFHDLNENKVRSIKSRSSPIIYSPIQEKRCKRWNSDREAKYWTELWNPEPGREILDRAVNYWTASRNTAKIGGREMGLLVGTYACHGKLSEDKLHKLHLHCKH